jgi:hypothetical protein
LKEKLETMLTSEQKRNFENQNDQILDEAAMVDPFAT